MTTSRPNILFVFTDQERQHLRDAGWWPVKLAGHILRFETAAIVAAVLMTSRDS